MGGPLSWISLLSRSATNIQERVIGTPKVSSLTHSMQGTENRKAGQWFYGSKTGNQLETDGKLVHGSQWEWFWPGEALGRNDREEFKFQVLGPPFRWDWLYTFSLPSCSCCCELSPSAPLYSTHTLGLPSPWVGRDSLFLAAHWFYLRLYRGDTLTQHLPSRLQY